ncbi:RNA polymerase II transcription mediator complex subunit 9-domain-containing protein [Paraphoma chrysanthemicola]|uniref:Mediator of RNA polymerase II transcription subunit 9 n=1 Tax=Paraphoma chrysanthemicola TaxID=798071 RepID=A0A8K0W443_9PLEO|nr:RNA polymerase II transcription mediator complex subunit 9-domain-containing protein [Paraphoma chrysanthemicola]
MSAAPTPHATASARASQPPTGAATPAPPNAAPAIPSIPPPSTFDVLPDLHKLLKRLLDTASQPPAATPTPAQPSADGPLEIQNVATAANDIRRKIQKARTAVLALPDVDRSCEDQEEEIEDLEATIARLKASLRELGRPVEETADGDQSLSSLDCMEALDLALASGVS